MKILLLYNGYPRLSQTYQMDEAKELNKHHEIMIFSWSWPLYTFDNTYLPFINDDPRKHMDKIKKFNPDIIHTHFLHNIDVVGHLSLILKKPYSIRTHSFDILSSSNNYLDKIDIIRKINSSKCAFIIVFPEFENLCIKKGIHKDKIITTYPSIAISRFQSVFSLPNGNDIMSGGAFLPKKDIFNFVLLAKKIKEIYPDKKVRFYSVKEEPEYYDMIIKHNIQNGSPVEFLTKQPSEMPLEYKKHEWLIYSACPILKTVGLPLMIAEAQASGVGVLIYNLRETIKDYITENGYIYNTHNEILEIIKKPFDEIKKKQAFEISSRYNIEENIKEIEEKWKLFIGK